jgi:purine-binding chemotaxis protein CheW
MTEQGQPAADAGGARRFLTFRVEDRFYALPAEEVSEVIRSPAVARVPQGPKSLLGIANLRGSVLPVASLRGLLGREEAVTGASSRAIVLNGAALVALAVDGVDAVVTIAGDQLESQGAALAAHPGEHLRGVFQNAMHDVVKVLDIRDMLAEAFTQRARPQRAPTSVAVVAKAAETAIQRERLVTFEVGGQEYALALDMVREIIPAPEKLLVAPDGDFLVLGVAAYREGLLPMLSLRGLLGFGGAGEGGGRRKCW